MAKERKIVTQIEIEALVAQAQKDLVEVGTAMESLWKHGEPPKKLAKEYENIKIKKFRKRFFRTRNGQSENSKTISSILVKTKTDNNSELKPKGLLIYNPKQLFAKLKQKKLKIIPVKGEQQTAVQAKKSVR